MSERGDKNAYFCEECGQYLVVVHVDAGVTPMFLACRATEGCQGTSRSMMYPPEPWPDFVPKTPTYEWYMPSNAAVWAKRKLRYPDNPAYGLAEHFLQGGLMLRKVGEVSSDSRFRGSVHDAVERRPR